MTTVARKNSDSASSDSASSDSAVSDSAVSDSAVVDRTVESETLKNVGRVGWVAKGAVYVLVGVLAVPIALSSGGGSEGEASRSGAIAKIAENSVGGILLVAMAIGLFIYALWRLTTAVLPGENDAETWAHRAAYVLSAGVYGFLAWSALSFVVSGGGGNGSGSGGGSTLEKLTRTLMETTGGRWLLGAGALVGLGVAAYRAYKAIEQDFMDRIDVSDASSEERELIEKLGIAGWAGRAITTALLAVFVLQAAWTADPSEAKGLDAALRDTADNWWGSALVLIAGVGLVAYGAFAVISARRRRLLGP